jgi:uncharacterized protein YndB with AHSA1/START domain
VLKWIVGILLALVLLVAGSCWFTYRRLASGGNVASVTVAATPDHVWRLLTVPDSLRTWYDTSSVLTTSADSALQVGDTLALSSRGAEPSATSFRLVLTRAEAPTLLVWDMVSDSGGPGVVLLRRTDSIVALGDSVRIVSVMATPTIDSVTDSLGGLGRRLANAGGRMAAGGFRMMAQHQLELLRERLQP